MTQAKFEAALTGLTRKEGGMNKDQIVTHAEKQGMQVDARSTRVEVVKSILKQMKTKKKKSSTKKKKKKASTKKKNKKASIEKRKPTTRQVAFACQGKTKAEKGLNAGELKSHFGVTPEMKLSREATEVVGCPQNKKMPSRWQSTLEGRNDKDPDAPGYSYRDLVDIFKVLCPEKPKDRKKETLIAHIQKSANKLSKQISAR